MRILRVAQRLFPETKGGGAYHVHAMSRDQAAMGHDVTVLTVTTDQDQPRIEERNGYTVVRCEPFISPVGNDIAPGVWRYLSSTDDFDVVHAHSHLYFSSNLAALKRRFGDVPLAITNHGLYSQTASKALQKVYLKTLGKWTFNKADMIFCYTEEVERRFRSYDIQSDIAIISNGIDHKRFRPSGQTTDLIEHDGPIVLCVVRLVEGKRPMDAIKAIESLCKEFPDVHLYLCGDGPLRGDLEKYVTARELESNVTLLGNVDYDEMPRLYRSCDALLLPSEEEAGAPRVVLEAMATEKPFVITEIPQTTTILEDTSLTAPVGDHEAIAAKLAELLSDMELREEIGREGRKLVTQEFNWDKTVTETTQKLIEISDNNE